MSEPDTDRVQEAVVALYAAGVAVTLSADELKRWQIGDLTFSDSDLLRLAEDRGLIAGPVEA